jgi:membrane associated rhomboid family serine protease
MNDHFTLSLANIAAKRYHTLLTYSFSHKSLIHGGFNVTAAYSFGHQLDEQLLGRQRQWVPLLFASGSMLAGLGSLAYKLAIRSALPTIGASGGAFTLFWTSLRAFPEQKVVFPLLPAYELSGLRVLGGLATLDVVGLLARWRLIDHACHLSGALAGLGLFELFIKSHPQFAYNGRSVRYYPDGSYYSGQFAGGCPHHTGTMYFASGVTYHGTFRAGRIEGQGVMTFPQGEFHGNFVRQGSRWLGLGHLRENNTSQRVPAIYRQGERIEIVSEAALTAAIRQYESQSQREDATEPKESP